MELFSFLFGATLGMALFFSPALIAFYGDLGFMWAIYLSPIPLLVTNANVVPTIRKFSYNAAQEGSIRAAGGLLMMTAIVLAATALLNVPAYFFIAWLNS